MKAMRQPWVWTLAAAVTAAGAPWARGGPPQPVTADDIRDMIASSGAQEDYAGADVVTLLDEADVYVQKSGLATTESCLVYKVLSDRGVRSHSALRWEFDPDTYRVTVKSVRVHRKDGTVDTVNLDSLLTQPAPQHAIYWGNQQHVLGVPRLQIGDALEVRTSKIGFNIAYLSDGGGPGGGGDLVPPMPGHWYEVTLFQGDHPIVKKRYSVHMPTDMPVQYQVYNGALQSSLWFADDYHVYTWTAEDVPAVEREPHMVALDDCVPKLVMATLESWEAKSRWFYEVNEPQFEADDAIRAKVAELTAGLKTEEEKIAACTHWVADNIRYYGTKRGPAEGYTLHRGIETFRDRGGVCKDKAGMLVTMLRVLGHEVYPALTMAGSRVEAIPADQFNHTVTVMRNTDGSFRILDPTWVPLSCDLWSSLEQLQGLVYGTPEGQQLTLSPYYTPEYNRRAVRSEGRILEDGTLHTRLTMDLQGASDNRFRRAVNRYPVPAQRAAFEEALNIAPNARIESLKYTDVYDYSTGTHMEMDVSAGRYAGGGDSVVMFRMPLMSHPLNGFFRASFMDGKKDDDRQYGARFWATRMLYYDETLALPDGWRVVQAPERRELDSPSASLSFEVTPADGALTYHFELALKKGVVPPEDYAKYAEALDAMSALSDAWIVCSVGEGDRPERHAALGGVTGKGGAR